MRPGYTPPSILIIDDTPENLRVAVKQLEAFRYEILTARDGETGIARARLVIPDLILLDVQMPGIDGYETCRRLKADPLTAEIPVIFMTVLSDIRHKIQGFDVGGVDYVTKPIEASELFARVRAHLQIRALQKELEAYSASLETRVAERTAALELELKQKVAYQQERDHLLDRVRAQSEQLRLLTKEWMLEQESHNRGLASTLETQVGSRLNRLHLHLTQALQLLSGPGTGPAQQAVVEHLHASLELLQPARTDAEAVGGSLTSPPTPGLQANPLFRLSTREYEVLQLMAAGKTNKEIAWTLDVARTTVSTYRMRIMEKLEVEDFAALLKLALQHSGDA